MLFDARASYGKSNGRSGNYSTNYQISGRELLDASEVRMLDNRYALLFIRGERPIMDEKYDLMKHPNIALIKDGGAVPYMHGEVTEALATVSLVRDYDENLPATQPEDVGYEMFSDEEIQKLTEN